MNAEELLIHLLNEHPEIQNAGLEVFAEVPAERPVRFVTVERTGGRRALHMEYPTWAVQVWDTTKEKASKGADLVAKAIQSLAADSRIAELKVQSIYSFPDPDSRKARYQLVVTGVTVVPN